MNRARCVIGCAALGLGMAGDTTAIANPRLQTVAGFEELLADSFQGQVSYELRRSNGQLRRERAGMIGPVIGALIDQKDLDYSTTAHVLIPRLEIGLIRDLAVQVALPVVVKSTSSLRFADPSRLSSSSVIDGILPMTGFDSQNGGGSTSSDTAFRSPDRSGLESLHIGLSYALTNCRRTPWLPTWKIGVDAELAVGRVMSFDPANPTRNSGVSRGVHSLGVRTSLAQPIGAWLPFVELGVRIPLAVRSGSPLETPPGADEAEPAMEFSGEAGLEVTLWDQPVKHHALTASIRGRLELLTAGRDYSPMWEVLALGGDVGRAGPLVLAGMAYPGVSNIQGHGQGTLGLTISGQYANTLRIGLSGDIGWQQSHLITAAPVGGATGNSLYLPLIDSVGRRYRVAHAIEISALLSVALSF